MFKLLFFLLSINLHAAYMLWDESLNAACGFRLLHLSGLLRGKKIVDDGQTMLKLPDDVKAASESSEECWNITKDPMLLKIYEYNCDRGNKLLQSVQAIMSQAQGLWTPSEKSENEPYVTFVEDQKGDLTLACTFFRINKRRQNQLFFYTKMIDAKLFLYLEEELKKNPSYSLQPVTEDPVNPFRDCCVIL
ncbi:MAG: hypothetical protein OXC30_00620 [Alphaproteobacteria bacterium]|nr:hypothetical protein [Alphaproteobacteria bacterium]